MLLSGQQIDSISYLLFLKGWIQRECTRVCLTGIIKSSMTVSSDETVELWYFLWDLRRRHLWRVKRISSLCYRRIFFLLHRPRWNAFLRRRFVRFLTELFHSWNVFPTAAPPPPHFTMRSSTQIMRLTLKEEENVVPLFKWSGYRSTLLSICAHPHPDGDDGETAVATVALPRLRH